MEAERPHVPAPTDRRDAEIAALARMVRLQDRLLLRRDRRIAALALRCDAMERRLDDARRDAAAHQQKIQALLGSSSWRITAPLRWLAVRLRRR